MILHISQPQADFSLTPCHIGFSTTLSGRTQHMASRGIKTAADMRASAATVDLLEEQYLVLLVHDRPHCHYLQSTTFIAKATADTAMKSSMLSVLTLVLQSAVAFPATQATCTGKYGSLADALRNYAPATSFCSKNYPPKRHPCTTTVTAKASTSSVTVVQSIT